MKNKSTIVYFGNNYKYAKSLCSDETLVNMVLPEGRCVEFFMRDGKPEEVARDGIEGDAEFLIFEENYLDNMFEYTYDMIETIKTVANAEGEEKEELLKKLQRKFNIQEPSSVVDKIRSHFELNEDARKNTHDKFENMRKRAYLSLTPQQEIMLSDEDKERIIAGKEQEYIPHEYKREGFEDFLQRVESKEENMESLKKGLKKEYTEEQIASFGSLDHEKLEQIIEQLLKKYKSSVMLPTSFFHDKTDRRNMIEQLNKFENNEVADIVGLIDNLLTSEEAEHELYAIIAEDFPKEMLQQTGLRELLGERKSELLKSFVLKMQKTEQEMKRDSLIDSGRRYSLGDENGYRAHVCIVSEKSKDEVDYSEVAMGYAKRGVSRTILHKLDLNETFQSVELEEGKVEENKAKIRDMIFTERAIKDLRYGNEMSEEEVFDNLFGLLKAQDSKIANHSMRVACWSSILMMMAHESKDVPRSMKIPVGEMKENTIAGGLHDVGKRMAEVIKDLFGDKSDTKTFIEELGRNTSALAQLPKEAKDAIFGHAQVGADALGMLREFSDSRMLEKAELIAREHHQEHKKNNNLVNTNPLINIYTLADCLDAIISGRNYNNVNEPMTLEGTIDILLNGMGGCIEVYRECDDERVPVKPGKWFMDENIKFHFNASKYEEAENVKFNPQYVMLALKFLRHQAVQNDKGKKAYMTFNDETISDEIRDNFMQIKDVTESYEIGGYSRTFKGERHLATSFAGLAMEQNTNQNEASKKYVQMETHPLKLLKDFVTKVKLQERAQLRRTARGGTDYCRA